MRKSKVCALILMCFLQTGEDTYAAVLAKVKPTGKILQQPDAPIEIFRYITDHDDGRVKHRISFKNRTIEKIFVIEFGVWSFDAFDNYMGERFLFNMDRKIGTTFIYKQEWKIKYKNTFTFFTGIVYVYRVRFEDGRIWKSDRLDLLQKLRKIIPGSEQKVPEMENQEEERKVIPQGESESTKA